MFSTEWRTVKFCGEVYVQGSFRGWVPVLDVQDTATLEKGIIYIGASSLYKQLKEVWEARGKKFDGLVVRLRKAYHGRFAPFECEIIAR